MKKVNLIIQVALMAVVFAGCSKDDAPDVINLKENSKTLYSMEEHQIDATSISNIRYSSENEYHATVSETGLVKTLFIGETNIIMSNDGDTKTMKITVKPKHNLYPEPTVKFGDLRSLVIAQMGKPDDETESAIVYSDYSSKAPLLMILFDDNDKMSSYLIMVKSSYSTTLAEFLLERYLPVSDDNDRYLFINGLNAKTASMAVGLELYNTAYWQVMYFPVSLDSQSVSQKNVDNTKMQFKELIDSTLKTKLKK